MDESLPVQKRRRLLPIREGQYGRRFVHNYLRLPEGDYFKMNFYENDRSYMCWRQLLLRQWLAKQLRQMSNVHITGNEYDINLFRVGSISNNDAIMFGYVMPEKVQPPPQLLRIAQTMKLPWEHPSVRARYLNAKYNTGEIRTVMTRSHEIASTPFIPRSPREQTILEQLMCPEKNAGAAYWKLGLFVEDPGHTFSIIVSISRKQSAEGSRCVIDDILILDTVIFNRENDWFAGKTKENIAIAMALNYALSSAQKSDPDNLFDLVQRVRRPMTEGPTTFLQKDEEHGFCQHWNTYFLFQILVMHEDPEQMYERLIDMKPEERWKLIVNFANDAVTIPIQMTESLHV